MGSFPLESGGEVLMQTFWLTNPQVITHIDIDIYNNKIYIIYIYIHVCDVGEEENRLLRGANLVMLSMSFQNF